MTTLSFSMINTLLQCPKKFYWSMEKKLRPIQESPTLSFGKIFHLAVEKGLEESLLQTDGWDDKKIALLKELVPYYLEKTKDEKILTKEQTLKMQYKNIELIGKIDALVEINGKVLVKEIKTTTLQSYQKEYDVRHNAQLLMYASLLKHNNIHFDGFVLDIVRQHPLPKPPKILKNGTLSMAKNQNTTQKLYFETAQKLGIELTPDQVELVKAYFPEDDNTLTRIFISADEIYTIDRRKEFVELLDFAITLLETGKRFKFYHACRTYNNMCPYAPLCSARDENDLKFLIENMYTMSDYYAVQENGNSDVDF